MGDRFFKRSRDDFWSSGEGAAIRACILRECGSEIDTADAGFEYCLAKVQTSFNKRDVFLATSDLCRALALLLTVGLIPLWRTVYVDNTGLMHKHALVSAGAALLLFFVYLSWRRMVRFREFTEAPVFRSYLAGV